MGVDEAPRALTQLASSCWYAQHERERAMLLSGLRAEAEGYRILPQIKLPYRCDLPLPDSSPLQWTMC